jgi:hypothetical protein
MPRNSSSNQAVRAARCYASGKLANAVGGLLRRTEGRICARAGHRYSPLVVVKTTTWPVPRQQTRKSDQMFPYNRERLSDVGGVSILFKPETLLAAQARRKLFFGLGSTPSQ